MRCWRRCRGDCAALTTRRSYFVDGSEWLAVLSGLESWCSFTGSFFSRVRPPGAR